MKYHFSLISSFLFYPLVIDKEFALLIKWRDITYLWLHNQGNPQSSQNLLETSYVCTMAVQKDLVFWHSWVYPPTQKVERLDLTELVDARVSFQVGHFHLEDGRFTWPCLGVMMFSWAHNTSYESAAVSSWGEKEYKKVYIGPWDPGRLEKSGHTCSSIHLSPSASVSFEASNSLAWGKKMWSLPFCFWSVSPGHISLWRGLPHTVFLSERRWNKWSHLGYKEPIHSISIECKNDSSGIYIKLSHCSRSLLGFPGDLEFLSVTSLWFCPIILTLLCPLKGLYLMKRGYPCPLNTWFCRVPYLDVPVHHRLVWASLLSLWLRMLLSSF